MPSIDSDHKWEVGVAAPARSLPGSPPGGRRRDSGLSLSEILREFRPEELPRGLILSSASSSTSSLAGAPPLVPACFRLSAEEATTIGMSNDLLDLTKPLPWDRRGLLRRGASTMSLDSLNENYLDSGPGETSTTAANAANAAAAASSSTSAPEDLDKTPVATCTCGQTTNFDCWLHRVPFGGAGELTEEISQTCLRLVQELRADPPGCDEVASTSPASRAGSFDFGSFDAGSRGSVTSSCLLRDSVDTPCSWRARAARMFPGQGQGDDTPSSKSSGSLASAPSVQRSELSTSPDSYDLLYKSFEVAVEMERLQLERGQSEGSSAGGGFCSAFSSSSSSSSLESLNRTSPKLQKARSQKRRSSPDGSVESPASARFSFASVPACPRTRAGPEHGSRVKMTEAQPYEAAAAAQQVEARPLKDSATTAQKVTFASLAKRKKKPETAPVHGFTNEGTHWTELVSGPPKGEGVEVAPQAAPIDAARRAPGNWPKRPHSLPIQLRHIQKPSSRPQQTPEQSQGGVAGLGAKGVTRTLSAPEGFGSNFPSKTTTWGMPAGSQSTHGLSLLTRKRHYNAQGIPTPQWDTMLDEEGTYRLGEPGTVAAAAGSPLINSSMVAKNFGYPGCSSSSSSNGSCQASMTPAAAAMAAGKVRVLAMDINANFTEPQEPDTFIPEHHHFIPQESVSGGDGRPGLLRGAGPSARPTTLEVLQGDSGLRFRSDAGVESNADWVPGQRGTWLDVTQRRAPLRPPATLDLGRVEAGGSRGKDGVAAETQTCSRGCSTDSPPAMDTPDFLSARLQQQRQGKACRDIGVSTDQALCGLPWKEKETQCPCIRNGCHAAEASEKTTDTSNKENQPNSAEDQSREKDGVMESVADSSSDPGRDENRQGRRKHQARTVTKREDSGKTKPGARESRGKKAPDDREKSGQKAVANETDETSVQSWHIGVRGRTDSQTIITCRESRIADGGLRNRRVKIQNVGASTLPSSSDKRYIRHRPLKPIRQVDAEHRQRKVLQQLYSNDKQVATPLPPTVNAWPGSANPMHPRVSRVQSLPANLQGHTGQSQAGPSQSGQSQAGLSQTGQSQAGRSIRRILSWESGQRSAVSADPIATQRPLSLDVSSRYEAGADNLPPQEMQVSPRDTEDEVNLLDKKALVIAIEGSVEHILGHFAKARTKSLQEKGQLGSTTHSPDIGHLMLHYLCPAVSALVRDGLRPHTTSFFVGRLKTSLWDVVEATTQLGPGTRLLHELVRHLSQQAYLKSSELRVNAFIMGLLNIRCLELWLEHIRDHPDIVQNLYEPTAFLSLCNGATRVLFDRLLVAVQPLTLLPFDLDYGFEHRRLAQRQGQQRERQQLAERPARRPEGGGWLRGTASLLWKRAGERVGESGGTPALSPPGLLRTQSGPGPRDGEGETLISQSSGQPVAGRLKTDENADPTTGGVAPTRDTAAAAAAATKEIANSWSLEWIKGFVAASADASTLDRGMSRGGSSGQAMTSSGSSSWSRIGSSLSKAFVRIKPDATARDAPISTRQDTPPKARSSSGQSPVSPGSPVKTRCHHVTMSQEELSFTKGSILTVQQRVDPDWLVCSHGNQSGLVHIDYVQGME